MTAVAQGIGVDPLRPPLAWEVWNGEAWIAADVFSDTTGGLNRSGEIVLLVPNEHELLTLGRHRRVLAPGAAAGPAARPADLPGVADGSTICGSPTHRRRPCAAEHASSSPAEVLGRSDGSPGQEFRVAVPPVLPAAARRDGPGHRSRRARRMDRGRGLLPVRRRPTPHFVWDSASGVVRFGPRIRYPDGSVRQHGRIPRDGAEIAVTGYRYGGGAAGNVGARTLTVMRTSVPVHLRLRSTCAPPPAGWTPKPSQEAKVRGPLTLRTGQRAVTAGDFERLTLESSIEVARARCLPSADRARPGPAAGGARRCAPTRGSTQLDDFALAAPLMRRITEHLDAHRLVGTAVEVGTPYYQGVSVAALVHAPPGRPAALVRQRAIDELTRYIHPLTGGADGAGWLFDADLNAAAIAQLLETVEGVDRVDEVQLFEYDLRTGQRIGAGRDVIRLDRHSLFLSGPHRVVVR